jgi:hypothetical protein
MLFLEQNIVFNAIRKEKPGWLSQYSDCATDSTTGVRFTSRAGHFSRHRVQTGSGVHPASYPMDIGDSFPGSKATGT